MDTVKSDKNGLAADQEADAIDALASDAVDLMDHKPGKRFIRYCKGGSRIVLNRLRFGFHPQVHPDQGGGRPDA